MGFTTVSVTNNASKLAEHRELFSGCHRKKYPLKSKIKSYINRTKEIDAEIKEIPFEAATSRRAGT